MTANAQSDRAAREIPVALEPEIARIALASKPAAPVTDEEREALRAEIKDLLSGGFGIDHASIEMEPDGADCDSPDIIGA